MFTSEVGVRFTCASSCANSECSPEIFLIEGLSSTNQTTVSARFEPDSRFFRFTIIRDGKNGFNDIQFKRCRVNSAMFDFFLHEA